MEVLLVVPYHNAGGCGIYMIDAEVSLKYVEDRFGVEGLELETFCSKEFLQLVFVTDILLRSLEEGRTRLECVAYFFPGVEYVKKIAGIQGGVFMHRRVDESDGNDVSLYEVGNEIFDVWLKRLAGPAEIIGVELTRPFPCRRQEKRSVGWAAAPLSGYGQNEQVKVNRATTQGKVFLKKPKVWSSQSGFKEKNSRVTPSRCLACKLCD